MPIAEKCPICDSKIDKGACPKCGIWLDHRSNASTAEIRRQWKAAGCPK
jgi:primosomal replication protein N